MLDRSPQDDLTAETRPVAFRGAGFMPKAGRYSGWIALLLVIALWQLAGSAGWINPLFLPGAVGDRARDLSARDLAARCGIICPIRSCGSGRDGFSAPSPA